MIEEYNLLQIGHFFVFRAVLLPNHKLFVPTKRCFQWPVKEHFVLPFRIMKLARIVQASESYPDMQMQMVLMSETQGMYQSDHSKKAAYIFALTAKFFGCQPTAFRQQCIECFLFLRSKPLSC